MSGPYFTSSNVVLGGDLESDCHILRIGKQISDQLRSPWPLSLLMFDSVQKFEISCHKILIWSSEMSNRTSLYF